MRPKKVILCVIADEQELSLLKFVLATHNYRVLEAANSEQAVKVFTADPVDLVLAALDLPGVDGIETIRRLKAITGHIPMILFADPAKIGTLLHSADSVLSSATLPVVDLLGRIKTMSARKRGPHKGTPAHNKGVAIVVPAILVLEKAV